MPTKVLDHFKKVDPILYKVIKEIGELEPRKSFEKKDYFVNLVESIISQQLSGKAADTIFGRFKNLFPRKTIIPSAVLKLEKLKIRNAGISYSKIKYIKDLSLKAQNREINFDGLVNLPDSDVISELTRVKGIGKWTAEMFLMFTLNRPDIFSHGDLGLNNAIKKIYKREKYDIEEIEKIVSVWSPHKTYASRILWKSLNNR